MKTVAMDIETDDLDAKVIHVICTEDVETGTKDQFLNVTTIPEERDRFIEYCSNVDRFVLHNGLGFDIPVINRLVQANLIRTDQVIDTLIVSRLIDFTLDNKGHSLKAWGQRLGEYKIDFGKDFSKLTEEMVEYCHQDVTVTVNLFKRFKSVIEDPEWQMALTCEHEIQALCEEMTDNGFYFEQDKAEELLGEIITRLDELEAGFQKDFPPKIQEVNRIKYRKKADGTLYKNVTDAQQKYSFTALDKSVDPPELVCLEYVPFMPSSPQQRIDRLWEAGWKPYEKTKGHIEYEREQARQQRSW